jgi:hypothetical protein
MAWGRGRDDSADTAPDGLGCEHRREKFGVTLESDSLKSLQAANANVQTIMGEVFDASGQSLGDWLCCPTTICRHVQNKPINSATPCGRLHGNCKYAGDGLSDQFVEEAEA